MCVQRLSLSRSGEDIKGRKTYCIFRGMNDTIRRFRDDRDLEWNFQAGVGKGSLCRRKSWLRYGNEVREKMGSVEQRVLWKIP
jgi:hypothetical protein